MTAQDWDAKAGRITERLAMEMPRPSALAIPNLRDRISAALASAYAAGRAEGASEMREEAAQVAGDSFGRLAVARAIRALPATPPGQSEGGGG